MTTFMHFTAARYTPRGWDNVTAIFRYFGWPVLTARLVSRKRREFAPDSALEGTGFEPSVSLPRLSSIRAVRAEIIGRSTDVFRRDREFDVSALQGRLSTSSQSQCSTDPGLIAGTWHRPLFLTRDRWFESGSLQRRVCEPPVPQLAPGDHVRRHLPAIAGPPRSGGHRYLASQGAR